METLYSLACCSPLEAKRAPSGIASDPIKTHRSAAGPNTPMACAPSRRWRVDHEILDEISPRDAIRGKPRETCPDARRRLGRRSARRFLHAAHTRDRANVRAATTRRSGRKHHGNLSHFLGFQPCGQPQPSWVWWGAAPRRSARTYQHRRAGRRRCQWPFHPPVGAVRRRSRSRNGPRVCCFPVTCCCGGRRPAARASRFRNRSKWSSRI
jgi:hypothetical protein